ncbi:MFS family permease [Sphingomonas jejuensis]|uniref:MFS family permease n=1 Tax=Sphingomonas jejuensis TaxID=904715 RepID=A0ABX0XM21_9SPHN|nr:MFS transporter [Sphingomonas jejuensis]NJC34223.1 MFS family permease [Sphingomonas jejuensis]
MTAPAPRVDRDFALLFLSMMTIAAGNTALQSVMPGIGRRLGLPDTAIAVAFSVSALLWVVAAPFWAKRSDRHGRRRMVLLGLIGFALSSIFCALALSAGLAGWIGGTATLAAFVGARLIYGGFGAATPPAAQAMVAERTGPEARTRALSLLASAFGLGTIIGPALAPLFVLPLVGLAGPAYAFSLVAVVVVLTVGFGLSREASSGSARGSGAVTSYPTIGGQQTGASVVAATAPGRAAVAWTDRRILPWMIVGLTMGHAQAMIGQSIGFLIIDRLALPAEAAQGSIGIVLMVGAGAALLAQWGLIPLLDLRPRGLVLWGAVLAAAGALAIALVDGLHALALSYALASIGFGFLRPGFTAGASLAVGAEAQGSVAGRTTAINGAAFVLGPAIGVGLYELWRPLPYLVATAALVLVIGYALAQIKVPSSPAA